MLWFEGSIPAAIASAKLQNSVFVVVITGDDEQSTQVISSWEDGRVTEATGQSFVAIKIDAKSETCVQFSEIYPVVCIPSSFFIGDNGIPLEVIAGSVPAAELVKRIEKVKQVLLSPFLAGQMHTQRQGGHGAGPTPPPSVAPETATPQEPISGPSGAAELAEPRPLAAAADGPAAPAASKGELAQAVGTVKQEEPSATLPETVFKAGQCRSVRDEEKPGCVVSQVQAESLSRPVEDSTSSGQISPAEESSASLDDASAGSQLEDDLGVKVESCVDRAERAARYTKTKEEMDAAKAAALQARQAELDARKESSLRERSAIARIQFRLPDGSFFTNQFPSESRLEEARQFAAQEVGNKYGNFSLATMFPRREFTGDDFDRTLLELELAPSASVVLLPTGRPANTVVQASGGGLWAVLGTLFYPLLAVWRFLSSFLLSSPPPAGPSTRQAPQPSTSAAAEPKRETVRKRVLEKRTEDFKKDGKIYRLRTQEDNEDDNNTWNGNSTQQM
uniref:UBX domain-containing protein 4 n=1 Tax=Lepisosteus oculatus TaxID=7918 RepID=W5M0G8_LEPOC